MNIICKEWAHNCLLNEFCRFINALDVENHSVIADQEFGKMIGFVFHLPESLSNLYHLFQNEITIQTVTTMSV